MLALRELLIAVGLGMMLAALGILLYDLYQEVCTGGRRRPRRAR